MALAEFDFYIVHRPGQEHVVPDFLSRNPNDKHPEFDNYVLLPIEVTNFFAMAFSFDIPYHEPSTVERYFGGLSCLYLSIFETENHFSHVSCEKVKNNMTSFTANSKPNTKFTKGKSHIKTNGTSDFNCQKDLNIKRMEFSKSQQEDLRLKLLFDFIQSGFD